MANAHGQGRKPKATVLKLLAGARPDRINKHEPNAPGDLKEAPEWMSNSQKSFWNRAIANAPAGLLRFLDTDLLTVWVVAANLHREATIALGKNYLVKTPHTKEKIQSPYLAIINRQAQIMMKATSELGFSPTSRSRIVLKASAKANPFEEHASRSRA